MINMSFHVIKLRGKMLYDDNPDASHAICVSTEYLLLAEIGVSDGCGGGGQWLLTSACNIGAYASASGSACRMAPL